MNTGYYATHTLQTVTCRFPLNGTRTALPCSTMAPPMTKLQAHVEARRRWSSRGDFGSYAQVCLRAKKHVNRCLVGYMLWTNAEHRKCTPLLIGEGATWEAAFANADEREAQRLPPLREGFL